MPTEISHITLICKPHCVEKFRPSFGDLDCSSTWKSLYFMPFDRQAIDLNWKVAHGVLYTAERLASFGYDVPKACFCGYHTKSLEHLFFSCPLAQSGIDFIQSLLFSAAPLAPTICINVRHMFFGFSSDELRIVPRVFCYLIVACKFLVWCQHNDFRFRFKLLATLRSRMSFHLPLFAKRFVSDRRRRYFTRQWGANGVIGSFCGLFVFNSVLSPFGLCTKFVLALSVAFVGCTEDASFSFVAFESIFQHVFFAFYFVFLDLPLCVFLVFLDLPPLYRALI